MTTQAEMEQHQEILRAQVAAAADRADQERRAAFDLAGAEDGAGGAADAFFQAARAAVEAHGIGLLPIKELQECCSKAPTFDEGKSVIDFRQHLTRLRRYSALWGVVADVQRKLLLVQSIEGESSLRIRHLDVDTTAYRTNPNYEAYEQLVGEVFHPVSERNLARADFLAKTQAADEDVSSYFSRKVALFRLAVPGQEELEFPLLREELISGLYSVPIKQQVWYRGPKTVEELHAVILETVGQERIAFSKGFGRVTSLDGLLSVTGAQEMMRTRRRQQMERRETAEPMEIGAVEAGTNSTLTSKFRGKCFNCNKQGHVKSKCPELTTGRSTTRNCHWCGRPGHWANNCPSRRAGRPKQQVAQMDRHPEEEENFEDMTDAEIAAFLEEEEAQQGTGINMLGAKKQPAPFQAGRF
mgnify:CR=1 FL=1